MIIYNVRYVRDPHCGQCDEDGFVVTRCCAPASRIECECGYTGGYLYEPCDCLSEGDQTCDDCYRTDRPLSQYAEDVLLCRQCAATRAARRDDRDFVQDKQSEMMRQRGIENV